MRVLLTTRVNFIIYTGIIKLDDPQNFYLAPCRDPASLGQLPYARREDDFYPTRDIRVIPLLLSQLERMGRPLPKRVHNPCCGTGHMAEYLTAYGHEVISSDLFDRGYSGQSFTADATDLKSISGDAIVENPPFDKTLLPKMIRKFLTLAKKQNAVLALFLRFNFDAAKSSERRSWFTDKHFLGKIVLPFRPIFEPVLPPALQVTPRHDYCWMVWDFREDFAGPGPTQYPLETLTPACATLIEQSDENTVHRPMSSVVCAGDILEGLVRSYQIIKKHHVSSLSATGKAQYSKLQKGYTLYRSNGDFHFCHDHDRLDNTLHKVLEMEGHPLGCLTDNEDGFPEFGSAQSWCLDQKAYIARPSYLPFQEEQLLLKAYTSAKKIKGSFHQISK